MKNKTFLPTCFGVLVTFFVLLVSSARAQFTGSEDFSGQLQLSKWIPFSQGNGNILLSNQEFNFTNSSFFGDHEAGLSWVNTPVSYSEDWEFQLDVENILNVPNSSRYAATGIFVSNGNDENDIAYLEFYGTYFDDLGQAVHGFTSGLVNNGVELHEEDTFELPFEVGALRAKYDSSEKSLTFYFHTGAVTDGYFWQFLAKYGLDGNDGTEANANWEMFSNAEFDVGLYGTSVATRANVGQLTADNFTADRPPVGLHEIDFELEASFNATGDAVALTWFSFDGLEYVVQESSDLMSWTDVATVVGTGDYSGLEVALAAEEHRFYRIYSRIP